MTTHIPSLTLPERMFANPIVATFFPLGLGFGLGFLVSRTYSYIFLGDASSTADPAKKYSILKQPPLSPPAWLFPVAWTGFYLSMGYASYRAWTTGMSSYSPSKIELTKHGATLYTIQLVLNQLFMPLFYGLERPFLAWLEILSLAGTVAYLINIWGQVDKVAGWFLAPYLGWLCFASYLCFGCGYLNNWDFSDKPVDPQYRNEAKEGKKGL